MFYSNEPAIKVTKIYPKKISLKSNETVDCTIILIVSATAVVAVYPSVSVASSPIPGPSKYKIAPHYLSSASVHQSWVQPLLLKSRSARAGQPGAIMNYTHSHTAVEVLTRGNIS